MKKFNTLFSLALLLFSGALFAQERYLDDIFTGFTVEQDIPYATNISVLSGAPDTVSILMDVYQPAGDTITDRPAVVVFHTGSFLPQYINGQITGSRTDSVVVEICRRLTAKGYVAIAANYRAGWNPVAQDQNVRTSTLIQAAYRGIQDARALIRFLRRDVDINGNSYGIDPDKTTLWGIGTGGYLSYGCAFLDRYEEVVIDKFIDPTTGLPFVVEEIHGDVNGVDSAVLNIPNWPEYSSDFALALNMGGALGDISWMEATDEVPVLGFHVVTDPFAPFNEGAVIVPTTGDFVVDVSGTLDVTDTANKLGLNAVFDIANESDDPLTELNKQLSQVMIPDPANPTDMIPLSVSNMFPFRFDDIYSGPWEWWDKATLDAIIGQLNMIPGFENLDADELHEDGLATNPNMSAEFARSYIDTIMNFFAPRAFYALNLATSVQEVISAADVELTVGPNPITNTAFFRSSPEHPMIDIALYNIEGKLMKVGMNANASTYEFARTPNIPKGVYLAQVRFKEGIVTKKLIFN